ncbi:MAG: 2-amino-4-hydroxy-6-hydroxymethyldihydropteridine diphosphokinase [Nitrospinaceae bacterium]
MPVIAYIGVGSNLGSPRENCEQAIEYLHSHSDIELISRSSFYETEPIGVKNQDWFINAAVKTRTLLKPVKLLDTLLAIERKMGRQRREKWGPRIIDLDLLFYGDLILKKENLQLPHPEIASRKFVLEPMREIAGDHRHPVLNKTISELLNELSLEQKVQRIPGS